MRRNLQEKANGSKDAKQSQGAKQRTRSPVFRPFPGLGPVYIAVFAFAFLLYANTLRHGYTLDDEMVLLKNRSVQQGWSGIGAILAHSFTYGFSGRDDPSQSYRPAVLITFAIEKQLLGTNPHTGHLVNVLLFALASVLLYHLLNLLWAGPRLQPKYSIWSAPATVPLLAALLFAAHPIHTEAVANIKGRDEILVFLFLVLSLVFVIRHADTPNWRLLTLGVGFYVLALFSKELAVTFLAVIPLTLWVFRRVPAREIALRLLPFLAAFAVYMLIRHQVLRPSATAQTDNVLNNVLFGAKNVSERLGTPLYMLLKYIALLFVPHPLCWDYSYNAIPLVPLTHPAVLLALVIYLALIGFAIWILARGFVATGARRPPTAAEAVAYAILYFFITISVVSNLIVPIWSTFGERFLFTPSLAFCIALPLLLSRFDKKVLFGMCGVVLAVFCVKTIARNQDWKDNYTLFQTDAQVNPNSSRVQASLGYCYRAQAEQQANPIQRQALYNQAIERYKKALEILPRNPEALYDLGVCYDATGQLDLAMRCYLQALEISPQYSQPANNIGVIYADRGRFDQATKYFEQAVQHDPQNADALGNLGTIHLRLGRIEKAIEIYRRALAINPASPQIRQNLAQAEQALKPKP